MTKAVQKKPPVLVLGGSSNALSIARSLGKRGIDVYLSVLKGNCAYYSRFARKFFPFTDKNSVDELWSDLLLNNKNSYLYGSVIFPCNDDGIEFVARRRKELEEHYILDESIPETQLNMLNKRKTLEIAKSIGLPVPKYLTVSSLADVEKLDSRFNFPIIVKPQHSHLFQKAFNGEKLFFVNTESELHDRLGQVLNHNLEVILSEFIPGPDDLLGSYYTYIDSGNNTLFHYTKRVVRRFPKNNGQGCYHLTQWNEEIAEIGLKFFEGFEFRGLGNVEFKWDKRDNQWKIIECNPRFTAAHELLIRCGMDISWLIYNHLAGLPVPQINSYRDGVSLWFPHRDYLAYKELKAQNEITFGQWFRSIARKHVLPHFKFSDPLPTIAPFWDSVKNRLFGGN